MNMKNYTNLWAPWRIDYILSEKEEGCIFCKKPKEDNDVENLILHRGKLSFIIFNRYPYNNGHLMVVPYRHISDYLKLTDDEILEINSFIKLCVKILKENMTPDGFNIGLNLGKAAGAGIDEHLHYHIVPRWIGDTNFMPVFSDTRVVPQSLAESYKILKQKIDEEVDNNEIY
jgi:ATP adenylyltransferase